jgi:hypothetical protein
MSVTPQPIQNSKRKKDPSYRVFTQFQKLFIKPKKYRKNSKLNELMAIRPNNGATLCNLIKIILSGSLADRLNIRNLLNLVRDLKNKSRPQLHHAEINAGIQTLIRRLKNIIKKCKNPKPPSARDPPPEKTQELTILKQMLREFLTESRIKVLLDKLELWQTLTDQWDCELSKTCS